MQKGSRILGLALAICLCAGAASAGPLLTANAYFDGVTTWRGSRPFFGTNGTFITDATVEYAVFKPGTFAVNGSLNGSPSIGTLYTPVDPSAGMHYVYAYQIMPVAHGTWTSTTPYRFITGLSVGLADLLSPPFDMNGPDPEMTGDTTTRDRDDPTSVIDKVPSSRSFGLTSGQRTSALWNFSPSLSPYSGGDPDGGGAAPPFSLSTSNILIFTSPWPPEWDRATIKGSSSIDALDRLPSPVPEPATIVLAIIGLSALIVLRPGSPLTRHV